MKALYIASTGMAAQERNVEIISNNIANMRTTGYKRQRAEFQDLLYQQYARAGASTSDSGTTAPVGIEALVEALGHRQVVDGPSDGRSVGDHLLPGQDPIDLQLLLEPCDCLVSEPLAESGITRAVDRQFLRIFPGNRVVIEAKDLPQMGVQIMDERGAVEAVTVEPVLGSALGRIE